MAMKAKIASDYPAPSNQWSPYNKSLKNRVLDKEKPYPKALIEANQRWRNQKHGKS